MHIVCYNELKQKENMKSVTMTRAVIKLCAISRTDVCTHHISWGTQQLQCPQDRHSLIQSLLQQLLRLPPTVPSHTPSLLLLLPLLTTHSLWGAQHAHTDMEEMAHSVQRVSY